MDNNGPGCKTESFIGKRSHKLTKVTGHPGVSTTGQSGKGAEGREGSWDGAVGAESAEMRIQLDRNR